jgi:hypothetical protein
MITIHSWAVLSQLAMNLPTLLVSIAAIVITLIRWQRAPKPALYSLLGFGLLTFNAIFGVIFYAVIVGAAGSDRMNMASVMSLVGIVRALLNAVGFVFLLIAIFTGREQKIEPSPFEPVVGQPPAH